MEMFIIRSMLRPSGDSVTLPVEGIINPIEEGLTVLSSLRVEIASLLLR